MATPIPAPERRVPGWTLVLALILAGSLVAVLVVFLPPAIRLGPPVLFLRVEDEVQATPENVTLVVNFGPHCSPLRWEAAERVLVAWADTSFGGVEGILLQHFRTTGGEFVTTSGDYLRTTFALDGVPWQLRSPADDRPLETFTIAGENVTVRGFTYGRGESWTASYEYAVDTPQGPAQLREAITFVNEGIVRPHIVPSEGCM